jgi:hypothetical protein
VEGSELSLVKSGANGRRILLRKDDEPLEFADMLAVPWEHEGALTDMLRKEGVDEASIDATIGGFRLLKAASDDLPEDVRVVVEKLGSEMYPIVNKPLNNMDGAESGTEGPNDSPDNDLDDAPDTTSMAKAEGTPLEKADMEPDEDDDTGDHENDSDGNDVAKADLSTSGRQAMASRGTALPDGSFPIPNVGYLKRAIRAFGRAGNKPRAKAWIIRRARALGQTSLLPEGWGGSDANVKKGGTMSEGTLPVPIRKEDGSWDLSGVPEENRSFFETVLKAHDEALTDATAANTELKAQIVKEREDLAKERNLRRESEFIQKAEGYKHLVEDPNELGPVLKEIADAVSPESFATLEKALSAAEARVETGDLFKELGASNLPGGDSGGDAMSKLEKMAEELVEKSADTDMTVEKAFATVLTTPKGRELYSAYLAGGVA